MHRRPLLPASLLQLLLLLTSSSTAPLLARADDNVVPTAVRKMSLDEGEMLMPEYLAFAAPRQYAPAAPEAGAGLLDSRAYSAPAFQPPWSIHLMSRSGGRGSIRGSPLLDSRGDGAAAQRDALARLQGRQFACPQNTSACTNIGQSDYCCASGTTCFVVDGAPASGNVGCCPNGQNCIGSVGECTGGSTACDAEVGGGCCIPGYVCANVGCIGSWVSLITQTTVTSTVVDNPTPTTVVTTVVVTVTPSIQPTTRTVTSTQTDQPPEPSTVTETATDNEPTTTSPTATSTRGSAIPPVQPTAPADYCPTGFYPCLAVAAGGGCCRTGRDCATTSCPPPPAMTTYTSNGIQVVVPLSDAEAAASALPTSTCAGGWFLCGKEAGAIAGCCPSGYQCGTASCTLVSGTPVATVNKELPSSGYSRAQQRSGLLAVFASTVLGAMLVV